MGLFDRLGNIIVIFPITIGDARFSCKFYVNVKVYFFFSYTKYTEPVYYRCLDST